MIDISVLYGGIETPSTPHRYGRAITQISPPLHQHFAVARSAIERRPIVVWNITRTCNLKCIHCYTDSASCRYDGELTTTQCREVLDDLSAFGVPVVLFSGGEPLMRQDVFELARYARGLGLQVVISTNGTKITRELAEKFREMKLAYVGISLDSATPQTHDEFRGVKGAFEHTMRGFRNCVDAGQKVGLRMTLTKQTCNDIDRIFDFIETEGINRVCFYHLCPVGRGKSLSVMDHSQTRRAMDTIMSRTRAMIDDGRAIEVLTVDNHCDGAYVYMKMAKEKHARTQQVLEMLKWNGGARYSSGVGIGNIDSTGNVHADQFSMFRSFGNVRERLFSEIWQDVRDPIMAGLKDRLSLLKGRCSSCRFRYICCGGLRARAELSTGDPWASDPACYLTDNEISSDAIGATVT